METMRTAMRQTGGIKKLCKEAEIDMSEEAKWREFTPATVDPLVCLSRIWYNGRGGQCCHAPVPGSDLCTVHLKQMQSSRGLVHGRVIGPIPARKLEEFLRCAATGAFPRRGRPNPESNSFEHPEDARNRFSGYTRPAGHGDKAYGAAWRGHGDPNALRRGRRPLDEKTKRKLAEARAQSGPSAHKRTFEEKKWLTRTGEAIAAPPPADSKIVVWSSAEVWAAALDCRSGRPHKSPRIESPVTVSVPGGLSDEDASWASLAATTLARVENADPRMSAACANTSAAECGELSISPDAVGVLRTGLVHWMTALLEELHTLSSHRVGVRDGVSSNNERAMDSCIRTHDFSVRATLLAEKEAFLEMGSADRSDPSASVITIKAPSEETEAHASEIWTEKLQHLHRMQRITPGDLRVFLRRRQCFSVMTCGLPESTRKSMVEVMSRDELESET